MDNVEKPNFIPCLTFVQRGVAKPTPERIKPSREELQEIIKEMKLKEAEYESRPKPEGDAEMKAEDSDDEIDAYYDMDRYDDEPTDAAASIPIDQLILQNSDESDSDDRDSEEEEGEYEVQPSDNLILVGHVDDDVCMLEVYAFNNDRAELFIMHDIFLPSYPIAIEWLDFNPKDSENPGHFAAVGSMKPDIDVWDLNVTGCLEPAFSLGTKKVKGNRHKEAVLDIAWNRSNRNILASGSADRTVILWDMAQQKSLVKLSVFEEKVQSLKWHPVESQNLLTGSCDGKVRLFDCRSTSTFKTWIFDGEIEKVLWNKFNPLSYFASNDQGMVYYVDIRHPKPIWNLKAHDKEVTGLTLSSHCQDLFLTASMDESVKVWDLKDEKPQLVTTKMMNIGSIYALSSCPDVPYVFCAGGTKKDNNMYLWDLRENSTVVERFQDRRLEETTNETQSSRNREDDSMDHETVSTAAGLKSIENNNPDGRIHANMKKKNQVVQQVLDDDESEKQAAGPSSHSHSNQQTKKSKNKKS